MRRCTRAEAERMAAQYLARADAMVDEADDLWRRGQRGRSVLVLSLAAVFSKAARRWSERAARLPFPEGAEVVELKVVGWHYPPGGRRS